jgi:hypothetical protein
VVKSFIWGLYHIQLIQSFPTTISMLKIELRTGIYTSLKFFGIHWLRVTWNPCESTSHVLSSGSFIHGGIPSTTRSHDWTQSSSNTQVSNTQASKSFDTSALNASLLLCMRPSRVLNSQSTVSLPRDSSLQAFWSLFNTTPKSSGVLKSRTPGVPVTSPTTLARQFVPGIDTCKV